MVALRCSAALAHAVPGVRLHIRAGEREIASVGAPLPGSGRRHLSPSAFRNTVAEDHAAWVAGRPDRFAWFTGYGEIAIDMLVPAGDRVLPSGVMRVSTGRLWVHAAAVARPLDACLAAIGGLGLHSVACRADEPLGVTVLHFASAEGDAARSRAASSSIQRAVATCAVADLEDLLRAEAAETADRF